MARQLIGEDSEVEKEYLVRVSMGDITTNVQAACPPSQIARLRHGLLLDDKPLLPAEVEWQNPEQLRFVLREGKKRQIRRMWASSASASDGWCWATCRLVPGGTWGRTSSFSPASRRPTVVSASSVGRVVQRK